MGTGTESPMKKVHPINIGVKNETNKKKKCHYLDVKLNAEELSSLDYAMKLQIIQKSLAIYPKSFEIQQVCLE